MTVKNVIMLLRVYHIMLKEQTFPHLSQWSSKASHGPFSCLLDLIIHDRYPNKIFVIFFTVTVSISWTDMFTCFSCACFTKHLLNCFFNRSDNVQRVYRLNFYIIFHCDHVYIMNKYIYTCFICESLLCALFCLYNCHLNSRQCHPKFIIFSHILTFIILYLGYKFM